MLENIFTYMSSLITAFNAYAKEYPFIAGAISLWGLGILSYFTRDIPRRIWAFIAKQTTTKLTLISTHLAYHDFLEWLLTNGYLKRIRSFKITGGKWGDDNKTLKSIGYGQHYFMYKWRPFKMDMGQLDSSASNMEKDQIVITIFGRSYKFFNKIFDEIKKSESKDRLKVNKWRTDYFTTIKSQRKRKMDTIFLNDGIKEEITNFTKGFLKQEDWYLKNGINYQTGMLFYGPHGTGKTSFIKALASDFNMELYILGAGKLHSIENAMMDLPEKSILLIEDIDTDSVTNRRVVCPPGPEKQLKQPRPVDSKAPKEDDGDNPMISFSFANLSEILNTIDGIASNHGRILIATTNHFEKLSRALIREGRFDLKVKFDYASNYVVKQFFDNYYPNFKFPSYFNVKDQISSSKIQNLILNNLDKPERVLSELQR